MYFLYADAVVKCACKCCKAATIVATATVTHRLYLCDVFVSLFLADEN